MSDELDQVQGEETDETPEIPGEEIGAEETAGDTDVAGESTDDEGDVSDHETSTNDQGVPAGFPAGLLDYAEDAGYSTADIAEMVQDIGPARAAKFFQNVKTKALAAYEGEPAPRQTPRTETRAPEREARETKKPSNTADFALPPEVIQAFTDAVGGDESLVKSGVGPLAQAINSHMQGVIDRVKDEILGQVRPVIDKHQAAEHERMIGGIWDVVDKAYGAGYGKIFGTRAKQTPVQKAVFDEFLGIAAGAAERMAKSGRKFTQKGVLQYALEKMVEGDDNATAPRPAAQTQAIKAMQNKIVKRANQISVAPSSGGGAATAKPLSKDQRRQSKLVRVKEVLGRRK